MSTAVQRQLPIGAEIGNGGVYFRVWAPRQTRVDVVIERNHYPLTAEPDGYFSAFVPQAGAGTLYQFLLHNTGQLLPDPASRFQPSGPHGPSQVVDPYTFRWNDHGWPGISIEGQIIYEMHIGTFTREGTWKAAEAHLAELSDVGITLLEVMPIADFPGKFGWGYDGVNLYAPTRLYGSPDDFRSFVNHAHSLGVAVILDVVYNHFGPDGNYLYNFSPDYFTDRYVNDWGKAVNFDGPSSAPVREFFISNAKYWIDEFHLDGLRLDATQQIFDRSSPHVISDIARTARSAAGNRKIVLVAENEPQLSTLVRAPELGGYDMDAMWNDDFHHSAHVALTGRNEAYYSDYLGTPQELISATKWGFLYQGQHYIWQSKPRGTPGTDIKPASFVSFIQNHDQVANSANGDRVHVLASPARLRALTALMLLGPATPMLFQGQEFGASAPFRYFADHNPALAAQVYQGRLEFLAQFPSLARWKQNLPNPSEYAAFQECKLDHDERARNSKIVDLHRDLIELRLSDPVFNAQRSDWLHGAVLSPHAFALRFFGKAMGDRLLLLNLHRDLLLSPCPEPLLAPPESAKWRVLWSSENPRYGGFGYDPINDHNVWRLPGESAVVLTSENL